MLGIGHQCTPYDDESLTSSSYAHDFHRRDCNIAFCDTTPLPYLSCGIDSPAQTSHSSEFSHVDLLIPQTGIGSFQWYFLY